MEGMYVFMMFFGFLFGATMIGLWAGYQDMEQRRVREQEEQARQSLRRGASAPRFFAKLGKHGPSIAIDAVDDRVVGEIEGYLRAEHELAEKFIAEPSVDNLYRQPELAVEAPVASAPAPRAN